MIVAFSSELLCRKLDNSDIASTATLYNSTKKEWYLKEVLLRNLN